MWEWLVLLNGLVIDTVYYTDDVWSEEVVKKDLVERYDYDENIEVHQGQKLYQRRVYVCEG